MSSSKVRCEISLLGSPIGAVVTGERLLSGVDAKMFFEVGGTDASQEAKFALMSSQGET